MENPWKCSPGYDISRVEEVSPRDKPSSQKEKMVDIMYKASYSYPPHHQGYSASYLPIDHDIEDLIKQFTLLTLSESSPKSETAEQPSLSEPSVMSGTLEVSNSVLIRGSVTNLRSKRDNLVEGGCKVDIDSSCGPDQDRITDPNSTPGGATCQRNSLEVKMKQMKQLDEQMVSVRRIVEERQQVESQLNQYLIQLAEWKSQHHLLANKLDGLLERNKVTLGLVEKEVHRVLSEKTEGEKEDRQLKTVLTSMESVNTVTDIDAVIRQAHHCMDEAQNSVMKCQNIFPHIETLTTSTQMRHVIWSALETVDGETEATVCPSHLVDQAQLLMEKVNLLTESLKNPVGHLRAACLQPVNLQVGNNCSIWRLVKTGQVFGVHENQYGLRFSRLSFENGRVYMHCLRDHPPPPTFYTMQVNDVMRALDPSCTLTFLDLKWPGSERRRVHIRLSPDTSAAKQFILLCTGQEGHSYLNTAMLGVGCKAKPGEFVCGGDYFYNTGEGGAPLLDHPKIHYRRSGKAGAVWSYRLPWGSKSAQFCITARGTTGHREWPYVFGEVESGLNVVKAAAKHVKIHEVTVMECGVVLSR